MSVLGVQSAAGQLPAQRGPMELVLWLGSPLETGGKNRALGLVGQASEGLFRTGEPCPPSKGSIFSSKVQPRPGLEAFPLLWGLRSPHMCSGLPVSLALVLE